MLAGVGGRTIAQAKMALSYPEFLAWMRYREQYGPLHVTARLEWVGALIAHTVASTVPRRPGARAPRFEDFLPTRPRAQDEEPISIAQAMREWR